MYVIGGVAIAAGGLAAVRGARRGAWLDFGTALGLLLVGTLLLLSVTDQTASRLAAVATTVLLIGQLAVMLRSRAQRRSAS
jgi:hypothetical protein